MRDLLPELYGLLAEAAWLRGEQEAALAHGEQSVVLAREMKMPREEGHNLRILGEIYSTKNDFEQAQTYYEESERILEEAGDEYECAKVQLSRAYLCIAQGDQAAAQTALENCRAVFSRLEAKADLHTVSELQRALDG